MILENKLNITNQVELAKTEEKLSKQKARQLFDTKEFARVEVGTFSGLSFIHAYLFEAIYDFAGKMRKVNIAKGDFRFAPLMYLTQSLEHIDNTPQEDINVNVVLRDETIWLTQKTMAELFDCSRDNISLHLKNIFLDKELDEDATTEEFSVVQTEEKRKAATW